MTLEEVLLQVLSAAAEPLTAALIAKQAKAALPPKTTKAALDLALNSLVTSGRVLRFPKKAGAATQVHTSLPALEAATQWLHSEIHVAKKPPEAAKLRQQLAPLLREHFEPALAALATAGQVWVIGPKRLLHTQPPRPSSLLTATQKKAVEKALADLSSARAHPLTWADFAAWVDQQTPHAAAPQATVSAPEPQAPPVLCPEASLLRAWYDADRLRSSTMMIPIPQTQARYAAWAQEKGGLSDIQVLRNFMQELYNNGLILLEPCERPQDLPEHERAMLVPMSLGPPGWSWCWLG